MTYEIIINRSEQKKDDFSLLGYLLLKGKLIEEDLLVKKSLEKDVYILKEGGLLSFGGGDPYPIMSIRIENKPSEGLIKILEEFGKVEIEEA